MPSDPSNLPYGRQSLDDADIDAVVAVLRSDWLTTGPALDRLETAFASATGAQHAVACANGTAALHLAYLALGLKHGDWVVVPAVTFLATANAARFVGAEIVFADVDSKTGLMTADTLEAALAHADRRAAAVAPVHLAGQRVDMDAVNALARRNDLFIVEDASHALGSFDPAGRPTGCGETCDAATFSLHPVKMIAAGEGGVVTTNDAALAQAVRRLRNHGMTRDEFSMSAQAHAADGSINPWYYEMPEPGFNYRLSDIHAALATSQLGKLERFVARRQALVERYDALLAPLAPAVRPAGRSSNGTAAWHLYVVMIDFEALSRDRAAVMGVLADRGIGSQVHYLPLHRQPYYRARYGSLDLPGADAWYARALSLPLFVDMAEADVERVVAALADIVDGRA